MCLHVCALQCTVNIPFMSSVCDTLLTYLGEYFIVYHCVGSQQDEDSL